MSISSLLAVSDLNCFELIFFLLKFLVSSSVGPLLSHDDLFFYSAIRPVINFASPVYLNPGETMDLRLINFCMQGYKIIHDYDKQCERCRPNVIDIADRRKC